MEKWHLSLRIILVIKSTLKVSTIQKTLVLTLTLFMCPYKHFMKKTNNKQKQKPTNLKLSPKYLMSKIKPYFFFF